MYLHLCGDKGVTRCSVRCTQYVHLAISLFNNYECSNLCMSSLAEKIAMLTSS